MPNAQTLIKNQALTQALNQALKLQLQNGVSGSTTSPLDLSAKKDEHDDSETGSTSAQAIQDQPTIAKIEEIDEIESADTRVSV